jgi:GST-like protein
MLEELGIEYNPIKIDIKNKEQFSEKFLNISPNNKIPAIVDNETGVSLMESCAILLYLAEKYKKFLPEGAERLRAIEWLFWQTSGLGPILGQVHHYTKHNKGVSDYSEKRYHDEALRLYSVLNQRLKERHYIAGEYMGEYSIADISCWPWVSRFEWQEVDLKLYPNVYSWYLRVLGRPAVQKGYHIPQFVHDIPMP